MVELNGLVVAMNVTCVSQSVDRNDYGMAVRFDQHTISLPDGREG